MRAASVGLRGGAIGNRLSPGVRALSPTAKALSPTVIACHNLPGTVRFSGNDSAAVCRRKNGSVKAVSVHGSGGLRVMADRHWGGCEGPGPGKSGEGPSPSVTVCHITTGGSRWEGSSGGNDEIWGLTPRAKLAPRALLWAALGRTYGAHSEERCGFGEVIGVKRRPLVGGRRGRRPAPNGEVWFGGGDWGEEETFGRGFGVVGDQRRTEGPAPNGAWSETNAERGPAPNGELEDGAEGRRLVGDRVALNFGAIANIDDPSKSMAVSVETGDP